MMFDVLLNYLRKTSSFSLNSCIINISNIKEGVVMVMIVW